MRDHRQGNDLAVLWSIFKDGEPFDLRGRSLKLYLKNLHERKEVVDFSVMGNEIHWTFYGKDQDTLGKHSLILVANEDEKGMITTDACDFVRLVSCSCKLQGGEDAPNVETESIELTSTLEFVAGADYDDTELREELSKKLEAEDVASTEPTAEFPQLLYTPQTLTEAQKAQARKNIGVGEGGGSSEGGAELVEFIADPLSEEDKAINAASYAKMMAGGDYIPCVKILGSTLDVSCWSKEEGGLSLMIDSNFLGLFGISAYILTVFSDGSVMPDPVVVGPIFYIDLLTTYESFRESALALVGGSSVNLSSIRVIGGEEGVGWVDVLLVQQDYVILTYTTESGVKYEMIGVGGDANAIHKSIIAGGTIYLDVTEPTSNEAQNNKMINLSVGQLQSFIIKVVNEDTDWYYTPIMIKNGAVVIYRNDTFEEWLIKADGTTTLSQ